MDILLWTSRVYEAAKRPAHGLTIRRIAENKHCDVDDLAQELVMWLFEYQQQFDAEIDKANDPDRYIPWKINNKARDVANTKMTAAMDEFHAWLIAEFNEDRVFYTKEFIRDNKMTILDGMYEPDSYSEAIKCDMLAALDTLNPNQRTAFYTTKHDDSADERQRRRDSALRSKAETKVWHYMNNYAYVRHRIAA